VVLMVDTRDDRGLAVSRQGGRVRFRCVERIAGGSEPPMRRERGNCAPFPGFEMEILVAAIGASRGRTRADMVVARVV